MIKNGIILAGGSGSRLSNFTNIYSKQLIYLGGRAVIDYPIKTLTDLGVEDITIILGSKFAGQIVDYCGDGSKYKASINYIYQKEPEGISQAINLCKKFVEKDDNFLTILGDNYYENKIELKELNNKAKIFLNKHPDLKRFGVATVNPEGEIIQIEEKPKTINCSNENYAITGLYLFNHKYFDYFDKTKKSSRGEYEIVDIIKAYQNDGELDYQIIDGEWSDAGTIEALNYLNHKLYKE